VFDAGLPGFVAACLAAPAVGAGDAAVGTGLGAGGEADAADPSERGEAGGGEAEGGEAGGGELDAEGVVVEPGGAVELAADAGAVAASSEAWAWPLSGGGGGAVPLPNKSGEAFSEDGSATVPSAMC
jgi:hypothetical protein